MRPRNAARWPCTVSLDDGEIISITGSPDLDIIALNDALVELTAVDPLRARMIELRFFAGSDDRRDRRGDGGVSGHRDARLAAGAGLAASSAHEGIAAIAATAPRNPVTYDPRTLGRVWRSSSSRPWSASPRRAPVSWPPPALDDPSLRGEVEALLDSHEQAGAFGTAPAFHVAAIGAVVSVRRPPRPPARSISGRVWGATRSSACSAPAAWARSIARATRSSAARSASRFCRGRGEITSEQLKRFEREARAVGALNHSNILTVYDIGVERGHPLRRLGAARGGNAALAPQRRAPCRWSEALDIARQIVSGLTAAHDKGVVHRDIKPENLFVTRDGVVKILDFGLAKQTGGLPASAGPPAGPPSPRQGLLLGTAGYMSPEQVRGQQADARSDVFAFGAVLYEMLTGRRAFTGDSVVETMNAILTSEPPPLPAETPELPAPLWRIVQQCLEKNLENAVFVDARARRRARGRPAFVDDVGAGRCRPSSDTTRDSGSASQMAGTPVESDRRDRGHRRGRGRRRCRSRGWGRPPRPGASGRPALAVMPLDDHSGDPSVAWLAEGLPRMLVTSLAQTPGLDVIGSERLQASFSELGRDGSDPSARGQVARHAGAGAVLAGSLFKSGSDIRIDVQVEDVETGRVVAAGSEQGQDVFALVDALTSRIRTALDVKDRPAGRPLKDVTTGSLVAYELYVKGAGGVAQPPLGRCANDFRGSCPDRSRVRPGARAAGDRAGTAR